MKIEVMEPILTKTIPMGEEWLYQIKWDGIRGITYLKDNDYQIFTKKGNERTEKYPELKILPELIQGKETILDGEIIVLDKEGKPNFQKILYRDRSNAYITYYQKKYPVKYVIFDMMFYEGQDLRRYPLKERLERLRSIVVKNEHILVTDDFEEGEKLYQWVREQGMEGIVAKQKNSHYIAGKKHQEWYKIKGQKKILVVIGGIKVKQGYPSSLLVGIYQGKALIYIGNVAIGLTEKDKTLLLAYKAQLAIDKSPFANLSAEKSCFFIKPVLTCWITFMEWTSKGGLRHPKMIGFSLEKPEKANGSEISESYR